MSGQQDDREGTCPARVGEPGHGSWFAALPEGESGELATLRVHGVLPGERVLLRPRAKDPGWADLVEVLEASPLRREAACPLFLECGGCHWLHMAPEAQRSLRREVLHAHLREAGVTLPEGALRSHSARLELGYRWRARFQADSLARPPRLGYHAAGSRRVVDAERCPLLAPELERVYLALREHLRAETIIELTGIEISLLPGADGALLFLNPRDRPPPTWPLAGERLLEALAGCVSGVAVRQTRSPDLPDALGARWILGRSPGGHPVAVAARGFLQSHLEAAEALAERVAALCDATQGPRVLELFAGSGLIGWRLAERGASVRAVELDHWAVEAGRALPPPSRGSLEWEEPGAAERLYRVVGESPFDALVADPPRSGLGALADEIAERGPGRVVLVSCSIRSLARDLARLIRGGYHVASLELFDLFPQSRHLETVALLQR